MTDQIKSYTDSETQLLYGRLRYTRYMPDLMLILKKMGKNFSEKYVRRVITGQVYNDTIWLAAHKYVTEREQQIKNNRAGLVNISTLSEATA